MSKQENRRKFIKMAAIGSTSMIAGGGYLYSSELRSEYERRLGSLMNKGMEYAVKNKMREYANYPDDSTALILVDVQPEFIHVGSEGYRLIRDVAEANSFLENLSNLIALAQGREWRIIYVPYRAEGQGRFLSPTQSALNAIVENHQRTFNDLPQIFRPRSRDLVLDNRVGYSAFSGTRLADVLVEEGLEHLVFAGPFVNVGLDSTVRDAVELNFHATLVGDCSAAFSWEEYVAAVEVSYPRFVHSVFLMGEFEEDFG